MDFERFKELVDKAINAHDELISEIDKLRGEEIVKFWRWFNDYDRVKKWKMEIRNGDLK